ncbi:MAG: hypothetical protein IPL32_03780 [Chloracidobacterium sp.]|nr:hypothetical protein [Chloracidobacterium sp.]
MGIRKLTIQSSRRFDDNYYSASLPLQRLAEGAIADLLALHRSDPRKVLHRYGKLEQCQNRLVEVDISGGCRLVAQYSNERLSLLDVGGHDVVRRYSDLTYMLDQLTLGDPPSRFYFGKRTKTFQRHPDRNVEITYNEETHPDWIYFLDAHQKEFFDEISESIFNEGERATWIVGGPGTGKTCILLQLLKLFVDLDYSVGIRISDALAEYIENSTGEPIQQFRVNAAHSARLDILLVDDPSFDTLKGSLSRWKEDNAGSVVVAFDPLQLDKPLPDKAFNKLRYDYGVTVHKMNQCYRQKAAVGERAKDLMDQVADSSPYLADAKKKAFREEHKEVTKVANELEFVNPHGYVEIYDEATTEHVELEVARILESKSLMWTHTPGLLILLDNCELSAEARLALRKLERLNYIREAPLERIEQSKGLEFQHVFIFIKRDIFDEIQNGFEGSGTATYIKRRRLRIPFTRAKDSLAIFGIQ